MLIGSGLSAADYCLQLLGWSLSGLAWGQWYKDPLQIMDSKSVVNFMERLFVLEAQEQFNLLKLHMIILVPVNP